MLNEATEHSDPFVPPNNIDGETEIHGQKFDWTTGILALLVVTPIAFVGAVFVLSPLAAIIVSVMSFSGGKELTWICQPITLVIAACFSLWMAFSIATPSDSNPDSIGSRRGDF